jgi:hypothetical protein
MEGLRQDAEGAEIRVARAQYPSARAFALLLATLFGLAIVDWLSFLPFDDPAMQLAHGIFRPSHSQMRVILLGYVLVLLGGASTVGWPARGFLMFGTGFFVLGVTALTAWNGEDKLLRVLGGCVFLGGLYTWLAVRQYSCDRHPAPAA